MRLSGRIMVARSPVPTHAVPPFPLDSEFQKSLLRLLMEDDGFANVVLPHLQPHYFENEVLVWMYSYGMHHREQYGVFPSARVFQHQAMKLDPSLRPMYQAVIERISQASLRDEGWMRDAVLDFVKRNIFVRTYQESRNLYNSGKPNEAYDLMMERMERIIRTTWDPVDEEDLYAELPARHNDRMSQDPSLDAIGTGIPALDHVMNGGLSLGELGIWIAYAKCGKALRDDQVVRTPTGWTPISELRVGDEVIGGSTGKPQKVTGVYPQGAKPLSLVKFSDGAEVVACDDHIWTVQTRKTNLRNDPWIDVTTKELVGLVEDVVWVPNTPVVEGSGNTLGVNPYVLGLLLGDGSFCGSTVRFCKPERDLWRAILNRLPPGDCLVEHERGSCSYVSITRPGTKSKSVTYAQLERLGLVGCGAKQKFIPPEVFISSKEVRRNVLAGLCDTDGHVAGGYGGSVELVSASKALAYGVVELCRSLGGYARVVEKSVNGEVYWRVRLTLLDGTSLVRSKKNVGRSRLRSTNKRRRVVSITPVETASCTCITVDDPQKLFITNDYVVTHNSTLLVNMGVAAAVQGRRIAHFVFEGKRQKIADRYDAAHMNEEYHKVRRAELSSPKKYNATFEKYQYMKGNLMLRGYTERWDYTVLDIHEDLKRWKREKGWEPDLLIIDYGDLVGGRDKHYSSETEKQKAAFRDFKSLANRGYAVWTASQARRPEKGAEDREHLVRAREIADCYEKVRVADFLGSHNITRDEKRQKRSRLFAELYRDNEAELEIPLHCDFSRMRLTQAEAVSLGYDHAPQPLNPGPSQTRGNF